MVVTSNSKGSILIIRMVPALYHHLSLKTSVGILKTTQATNLILKNTCQTQLLDGQCPAEFSSSPN